jgi:hypothetical protein
MADLTNATVTFTYECPYRNICSDNGKKCETCRHNPKRSYYEPVEPFYPWYPPYYPYPYYPYYPWTITWDTNTANDTGTSHYQSA